MKTHKRPPADRLVARIPQIDGGTRELYADSAAQARRDRETIRQDRAMIDGIGPAVIVDIDHDGSRVHVTCDCERG